MPAGDGPPVRMDSPIGPSAASLSHGPASAEASRSVSGRGTDPPAPALHDRDLPSPAEPSPSTSGRTEQVEHLWPLIDEGRYLPLVFDLLSGHEVRSLHHLLESEAHARQGRETEARSRLDLAHAELLALPVGGLTRRLSEARLELVMGRRELRRGDLGAVRRHLRNAHKHLGKDLVVPPTLHLALTELRAIAAIMGGANDRALGILATLTRPAELVGDRWVARVQRLIGAIHARRGRPLLAAQAYRQVLSRLRAEEEPLEVAKASSNLAMVSLMAGHLPGARASVMLALELREAHRAPVAELANSTAVLALIEEREDEASAVLRWERAVELARRGPDRLLTAEIEVRSAVAATERGEHALAEALLSSALERCAGTARVEPTVSAMAAEAMSRLALARGRWEEARTLAQEAHSTYRGVDAGYHVARLQLLLGRIERHLGEPSGASRHVSSACSLALRYGCELAWREVDLEALRWAAELGDAAARRYCRTFQLSHEAEAEVLILARSGSIEAFGKVHELGRNALPFRLARALVAAAPGALSAAALCRRLWPDAPQGPRTANRLKVHLHRLRELLGLERPCVLTEVASSRGAPMTRYRWNPGITARILTTTIPRQRRSPLPPPPEVTG